MLDGMHLLEAIRVAVLVLIVTAVGFGTVALARWSPPTATIVVVPVIAPVVEHAVTPVGLTPWENCMGYDRWRRPTDPRWWCGLD